MGAAPHPALQEEGDGAARRGGGAPNSRTRRGQQDAAGAPAGQSSQPPPAASNGEPSRRPHAAPPRHISSTAFLTKTLRQLQVGRNIRPRPINPDERLPVAFLAQRTWADGQPLEQGLVDFLKAQDAEQELLLSIQAAADAQAAAAGGGGIAIPQVRPVPDYDTAVLGALREVPTYAALDPATTPYFRFHAVAARQTVAQVLNGYDMDSEDEAALDRIQAKAAARASSGGAGPKVPTAARRSSGGGREPLVGPEAASAPVQAAAPVLTPDQFEALIQRLEYLHFEGIKARAATWQADIKANCKPRLPAVDAVLSRAAAVRLLVGEAPPWVLEAVYDHWRGRRRAAQGPLLTHLRFQMPFKAQCYPDSSDDEAVGSQMPFMVYETRNSRPGPRLRVNEEEVWDMLAGVRAELEALRTLADQVRKRERLKKQLLKGWRDHLRLGKQGRKLSNAANAALRLAPSSLLSRHAVGGSPATALHLTASQPMKGPSGGGGGLGAVAVARARAGALGKKPSYLRGHPPLRTPSSIAARLAAPSLHTTRSGRAVRANLRRADMADPPTPPPHAPLPPHSAGPQRRPGLLNRSAPGPSRLGQNGMRGAAVPASSASSGSEREEDSDDDAGSSGADEEAATKPKARALPPLNGRALQLARALGPGAARGASVAGRLLAGAPGLGPPRRALATPPRSASPGLPAERRRLTRSNPNAAPSPTTAALLVEQGLHVLAGRRGARELARLRQVPLVAPEAIGQGPQSDPDLDAIPTRLMALSSTSGSEQTEDSDHSNDSGSDDSPLGSSQPGYDPPSPVPLRLTRATRQDRGPRAGPRILRSGKRGDGVEQGAKSGPAEPQPLSPRRARSRSAARARTLLPHGRLPHGAMLAQRRARSQPPRTRAARLGHSLPGPAGGDDEPGSSSSDEEEDADDDADYTSQSGDISEGSDGTPASSSMDGHTHSGDDDGSTDEALTPGPELKGRRRGSGWRVLHGGGSGAVAAARGAGRQTRSGAQDRTRPTEPAATSWAVNKTAPVGGSRGPRAPRGRALREPTLDLAPSATPPPAPPVSNGKHTPRSFWQRIAHNLGLSMGGSGSDGERVAGGGNAPKATAQPAAHRATAGKRGRAQGRGSHDSAGPSGADEGMEGEAAGTGGAVQNRRGAAARHQPRQRTTAVGSLPASAQARHSGQGGTKRARVRATDHAPAAPRTASSPRRTRGRGAETTAQ